MARIVVFAGSSADAVSVSALLAGLAHEVVTTFEARSRGGRGPGH